MFSHAHWKSALMYRYKKVLFLTCPFIKVDEEGFFCRIQYTPYRMRSMHDIIRSYEIYKDYELIESDR